MVMFSIRFTSQMILIMILFVSGAVSTTNSTDETSTETEAIMTTKPAASEESDAGGTGVMVLGVVVVVFLIFVAIGAGIYFSCGQGKREFQRDMRCDQFTMCKDPKTIIRDLALTKGAVNFKGLRMETAKIEKIQSERKGGQVSKLMLKFLHSIADAKEEKKLESSECVAEMAGCRAPKVAVRKDTQLMLMDKRSPLHVNQLFDYYGNTMLMCQAPLPEQFVDQFEAIWQEKVGVVVWLGPLQEKDKVKIDPYIVMEDGGSVEHGGFTVRTGTKTVHQRNCYVCFEVLVKKGEEERMIEFFHFPQWPDDKIPSDTDMSDLADGIATVRVSQVKQSRAHGLAGVLAHCSLGVERAAGFAACYIGNEMWLDMHKMNVLGILQFVRRNRWKAFGMGEPDVQIRVVYKILERIATIYNSPGACPLPLKREYKKVAPAPVENKSLVLNKSTVNKSKSGSDKDLNLNKSALGKSTLNKTALMKTTFSITKSSLPPPVWSMMMFRFVL